MDFCLQKEYKHNIDNEDAIIFWVDNLLQIIWSENFLAKLLIIQATLHIFQKKLLDYYYNLFKKDVGEKTAALVFWVRQTQI